MDDVSPEFNFRQLVDQTIIADAGVRHSELTERLREARIAEATAAQAIETTDRAFSAATVAGDAAAAEAAADAHAAAVTRARLLSKGVGALELALAESKLTTLPAATAAAWLPVATWARSERMAASQTRDAAFAMLAEASARAHRANIALQQALHVPAAFSGFAYRPDRVDPVLLQGLPLSVADEIATWLELNL